MLNILKKNKLNIKGSSLAKILKYVNIKKIILALSFGLGSSLIDVSGPRLLAKIINEFAKVITNKANFDLKYIIKIALIMVIVCLIGSLFLYLQNRLMANISVKLTYQLRRDILNKINRLPIKYFDKISHGNLLSRLTNDVDIMTSTLSHVITHSFIAIITIIATIIMMYIINWVCATIVIMIIILDILAMKIIISRSQKYFNSQQNLIGELNGYIDEIFSKHSIIRGFNKENNSIKIFSKLNNHLYNAVWKSSFFSSILVPIIYFLGNINQMLVISVSCIFNIKGLITIGDISSFITYSGMLNHPILQMANITSVLQRIVSASNRVFSFLEEPEEENNHTTAILPYKIKGNIKFENVYFSYDKEKYIIKDISFNIKAGQKVAFVGATGSGKTTIVKLLMRFYEIDKGNIYIDGINIKNISKTDLRKFFAMVLQDSWLFTGSIYENIKYGNENATESKIKEAAKMAYIDKFIESLPEGYETILNNEANHLSQGEKQLFTIARVMTTKPDILILDEATSSIDIQTEAHLQKATDRLMFNKTSLIIAHRLNTIKNADIIYFMSHGEILESGNHRELLAKEGAYAAMYNIQFKN